MAKKAAFGIRLFITDPEDSSLLNIAGVGDLTGPEISVNPIDVTSHDSPDGFAEFRGGLADAGEVGFELFFDPNSTAHARLVEMVDEGRLCTCALLLPPVNAEMLQDPGFDSEDTSWDPGTGWTVPAGTVAIYSSSNPGGDLITSEEITGLLQGERYKVAVTFAGSTAGSAAINVLIGGVSIGTVTPSNLGQQVLYFTADGSYTELALEVPASISGVFGFSLASVSLTGPSGNELERFDFTALPTKVGTLTPVDGALKASIALKVSGKPTYLSSAA